MPTAFLPRHADLLEVIKVSKTFCTNCAADIEEGGGISDDYDNIYCDGECYERACAHYADKSDRLYDEWKESQIK